MADSSTAPPSEAAAQPAAEKSARAFIAALEGKDLAALERTVHPQATLTIPFSVTGAQEPAGHFSGKNEVMGYLRGVVEKMDRIAFTGVRVSVTEGGDTSFVQAGGDFTAADGRPYNNVYILRIDWQEGMAAHVDEYANPVAFTRVFGEAAV